jgi:hypothetical protein
MPYNESYLDRVAALGCIICEQPAEIHHIRDGQGMSRKASDKEVLPLCPAHHRHGGPGVAFHAGKRTWESLYGTQRALLEEVKRRLNAG